MMKRHIPNNRPISVRLSRMGAIGLCGLSVFAAKAEPARSALPENLEILLEDNCWSCHEDGTEKGGLRLDNLDELPLDAWLETLNRVREQVYFKQMPPPDKRTQPSEGEREELLSWLSGELHRHHAAQLEDKLRYPDYGNAVDHSKLFSGEIKAKAFSPARRWLVSPQIFHQRVLDVFGLEGKFRNTKFHGVVNPFVLPDKSGVRYYDNDSLDGGHLVQMMSNAEWITQKQIHAARVKKGEIGKDDFPDPRDRWAPPTSPVAFETVILKDGPPTDAELIDAISTQFNLVLRRDPSSEELAKYLELARYSVRIAGNSEGLRQVLVAVLLESEFVYRLEFGSGVADVHGRKMLSPREGAYALSYAIGDRGPDAKLLDAAASGKLATREDYRREALRLLGEKEYYMGVIDPEMRSGNGAIHVTSHPRINRFFRDFFGYPMAVKVFKDIERSDGYYRNPERKGPATPGYLVDEADRIVDWHLQNDTRVFESILTSDRFFVYHNRGNEEGAQVIKEWREVYEALKGTDWRSDPAGVYVKHAAFIAARPSMDGLSPERPEELLKHMHFFEEHFGQGISPFTSFPWKSGFQHSVFYNFPPTPSIWSYAGRKPSDAGYELRKFWDYPTTQPFRIENRKGILTHPAWLIAHSTNFHADAVRRGRWIREKLLAGRVPDVPITVDAQVPEDPHRSFRDRVVEVTSPDSCWKCHQQMNPLGLAFEMYDDFGRFRTREPLENEENLIEKGDGKHTFNIYKTLPVDSTGELSGTGDPSLDGRVGNALDLVERIAKSERVRQSIIRHAFRFYMGRNEQLHDSQTLIDADRAYLESGGSFRAVILSLLTSDSFLYRKQSE